MGAFRKQELGERKLFVENDAYSRYYLDVKEVDVDFEF